MMRMISANSFKPFWNLRNPEYPLSSSHSSSCIFLNSKLANETKKQIISFGGVKRNQLSERTASVVVFAGGILPVDPWAPNVDSQSIASQLFAVSLFPYLGFLYFLTKSKSAPKLTLFGFYFLLAFVGATIPAGIYAKVQYGTSLSNVDWLHGGAESLLTLSNLFVVLGLRDGLRKAEKAEEKSSNLASDPEETSST